MTGLSHPSFSRTRAAAALRGTLGSLSLMAALGLGACATPGQETYQNALADARTDPALCSADSYAPAGKYTTLVAESWLKAHQPGNADAQDAAPPPRADPPPVTVSGVSAMPDVSFPPYSQRACRMTVQSGTNPPETGFLTVAYFIHNDRVDTSLARWDSDGAVSRYYDALKEKVRAGVDMSNPTLQACMKHFPALHPDSTDPAVQQAAVSLRALLIRHCLADHAALQNLYSDMYFIHR
ncbi:hypothetical protein K2X14_01690 [Acetobacter sp. TBRC 12305]|uniref:Lipoprotein n=1 Tax=Acetobacter garciniae TaxID=2817435 RepID=A0A939HJG5_9PROT|nr:hypothetical protein [Acetobacter garciniae]MBO1323865.1 hypothetical protein [Acetobacter garciniae]MBX0343554.1 hypothetical protein [Acetobacter garciniae]